jgi:UDPglucose 6-dehydrogenase
MNVVVIGTGFVGVVTSAVLAELKHSVIGLDIDAHKIELLNNGKVPFFEPDLEHMLNKSLKTGTLCFTTSYKKAIPDADVIIIAVGTPSATDGTADLTYVLKAAESLAPYLKDKAIVAIKSTVPPSTTTKIKEKIENNTTTRFFVAALPEFLREGSAVEDTLHPDRILIGSNEPFVTKTLLSLHESLGGKRVVVSPESANMAKYTANAYLALRITFINQISNLCEKNGAKISEVIEAIGEDRRIGSHYWYPGLGYGGSCFPKDVKELAAYSISVGEGDGLLVKIDELNEQRIGRMLDKYNDKIGGFAHKHVAVWGLAFKPNTNDLREAPSLKVIPYLIDKQASLTLYDPKANLEFASLHPALSYAPSALKAVEDADVIMLLTEWEEFATVNLKTVSQLVKKPCTLIDTRNQFDRKQVESVGLSYISVGNS